MGPEQPSFGEIEKHLDDVNEVSEIVRQEIEALDEQIRELEAQLAAYISLHEAAQEEQLKPIVNEGEIEILRSKLTALKDELEKFEGQDAQLIRLRDRLEVEDQKLTELIFKARPTEVDNPDDSRSP